MWCLPGMNSTCHEILQDHGLPNRVCDIAMCKDAKDILLLTQVGLWPGHRPVTGLWPVCKVPDPKPVTWGFSQDFDPCAKTLVIYDQSGDFSAGCKASSWPRLHTCRMLQSVWENYSLGFGAVKQPSFKILYAWPSIFTFVCASIFVRNRSMGAEPGWTAGHKLWVIW